MCENMVLRRIFGPKIRFQTEDVWEQGAKENIWAQQEVPDCEDVWEQGTKENILAQKEVSDWECVRTRC